MTKDEFFELKTSKEMWKALVENAELLKDAEAIKAFNEKRTKEFETNVTEAFGSFNPRTHYDWDKNR